MFRKKNKPSYKKIKNTNATITNQLFDEYLTNEMQTTNQTKHIDKEEIPPPYSKFDIEQLPICSINNSSIKNVGGITKCIEGIKKHTQFIICKNNVASIFDINSIIKIDNEYIKITNIIDDLLIVARGQFNSKITRHKVNSIIRGVYIGTSELNSQLDIMISIETDVKGLLYLDFSIDNITWNTFPTTGFTISKNIPELHFAVKGNRYFRFRFENGSSSKTKKFSVFVYYGNFK